MISAAKTTVRILRSHARLLSGEDADYDSLLDNVRDQQLVLLGEASHGTHEFYLERARITQRLIEEKGFNFVAVEADFPDAVRVHRYVQGRSNDFDAEQALTDFRRFPAWMWRNTVVRDFVEWLRQRNAQAEAKVGFFGMDLYSLHASIDAVLTYLQNVDTEAAVRARERYSCFDHFGGSPQGYGYAAVSGQMEPCEQEVVQELTELRERAAEYLSRDGSVAMEEQFLAEQNARVIQNAEQYYRSMCRRRDLSWNLRDTHMADTIDAIVAHARAGGIEPKIVVWAHNSHLGDARASEMGEREEINVGQLVRERYGDGVVSVGFSTYSGTVTAATDWGEDAERKIVRPGLPGSYEDLFHQVGQAGFMLDLHDPAIRRALKEPLLQRAIGVIYRPRTERLSHYFQCDLPRQFDWMIHFDETQAVQPLESSSIWDKGEIPETYPFKV